ncbi:hypothetical protein EDD66_104217 [Mobilisporobacter senegalensis]|uniref:Uncharacterized protein n=1 Tax=Mobilisporobacter senegalensis TaxID=1329262 RepID=A0A3N1XPL3_9FIRM|nr:hypothetical protein [Mobilisporobacter senegalensis]ROR28630.1 hypothetical protein EDD66_104217 [Mobilisporobacter senegalensis]
MQVLVKNTYHCDLIECPDHIIDNLVQYQSEFDKWAMLHDCMVNLDTFIEWVNSNYLNDSIIKIKIISIGITPSEEQKKLPFIYY